MAFKSLKQTICFLGMLIAVFLMAPSYADAAACGGENQRACKFASAIFNGRGKCPSGSFFDPRNGGECWSCPSGYRRGVKAVTASDACFRPSRAIHSSARFQKRPGCPGGAFFDPRKGGECWDCPPGYRRSTAAVTAGNACVKSGRTVTAKAKYHKKRGCPRGTFFDPRKGGECWSCPSGYKRSAAPVTAKNACAKRLLGPVAKAKYHGKHGCPRGTFFDPRKGGECWSCPGGYRRTATAVTAAKACAKRVKGTAARAAFKGRAGCPGGTFFDPRKGGECWSCPNDYRRTAFAVTASKACVRNTARQPAAAKFRGKHGCPRGTFFDPRNGGECWSCPSAHMRTIFPVNSRRACTARKACGRGLIAIGGVCRRQGACGGLNQRPCTVIERIPSCNKGLKEDFARKTCTRLGPGETPFLAGLGSLSSQVAKGTEVCQKVLGSFPQIKTGLKAVDVSANCQTGMSIGFVCAAPGAADKIADSVELTRKISVEFNRSPCKDELRWYARQARRHGNAKGLNCPRGQFFDPIDGGTCWSCPSGFNRSVLPVTSRAACDRATGTPAPLRSACALSMALLRDADKGVRCMTAMVRSGLLAEGLANASTRNVCVAAGEQAFFMALDYATGKPDPKSNLSRLMKRLKKANKALNSAQSANAFVDKLNALKECRGVL